MSDPPPSPSPAQPALPPPPGPLPPLPEARVQTRRPFHVIWLIPVVAAIVAAFLGWRALSQQGATISITFNTAEGLVAGQTKIRHKAVDLGTVRHINLAPDMSRVIIEADMRRQADRYLTANARFWVVRPRLAVGNISGLDTLLSGSYIEMDPGQPVGPGKMEFTGLEEPPAIRSDEPGRSFVVIADRIGSLSSGSPVFYRDITAGEVLSYEMPPMTSDEGSNHRIRLHVFIRSPYDQLVHEGSYFWNASGISVQLGAEGVRLQLESLQALLSGGIAFDTPTGKRAGPPSEAGAAFPLYADQAAAVAAGFRDRIAFLSYLRGSVRGLAVGAPVELFGIQVGSVTGVHLQLDPSGQYFQVAVAFQVQPERIFGLGNVPSEAPLATTRRLVEQGMRMQLRSANLLTGQQYVSLDFFPGATPAEAQEQDGAIVMPTLPGGLEGITASVGQILQRVQALPLEEIGRHLNAALAGLDSTVNGPELKQSLRALTATLAAVQELARQASAGAGPALERLPQIAQNLQTATDRAARLLGSADTGYGANSQFRRELERLLDQVGDTARSVRLLADYLDQHPEALLRGRTGQAGAP
jgi:paraquat-inducible protein B